MNRDHGHTTTPYRPRRKPASQDAAVWAVIFAFVFIALGACLVGLLVAWLVGYATHTERFVFAMVCLGAVALRWALNGRKL